MKIVQGLWVLIVSLLLMSSATFGQVATPSLDTSLREDLAAATGWRYSSTVAASVAARTWSEIYQSYDSDVVYQEVSYLLASHIIGPLYSEAFSAAVRKESENDYDYKYYYQNTRSQVNFALRIFEDSLCLGGHYSSSTVKEADETPINRVASIDEQIGIGLGASIGFGEWLYFAGGLETVSETSDVKVANTWTNMLFGIAVRNGFDENSSYRLEYSRYISNESIKDADDTQFKNSHFARGSTKINAEYMLESVRAIFRYENEHVVESIASDQNLVQDITSYGLTWNPPTSWIMGFEMVNGKEKAVFSDSSLNYKKADTQSYRLKVGYSF